MDEKPVLYKDLILDYQAFSILSSSRPAGMAGSRPIPLGEILAFMQMFHINDYGQRKHFLKRIKLLDKIYMDIVKKDK